MCLAYVDRFVIANKVSLAEVGRYSFWQSIVALLPVVAYAMAGMHFLPRLIESYKHGELSRFANYRRQFLTRTWVVCLPAAAGVLAVSPLAPTLLGKSGFDMPLLLVALMALAACTNALWQVPYQVLYSAGDDRFLAAAVTSITGLATLASFALVSAFGVTGAVMGSVVANATMYLVLDRRSRLHVAETGHPVMP
jgi:O-antigen/teichoic acid export membrane protein